MPGVDASAVPAPEKFPHGSGFWAVALAFLIVIGEPAGRLAAPGQASSASSSRDPRGFLRNGLFAGLSGLFLTTTDFVAVRVPEVAL